VDVSVVVPVRNEVACIRDTVPAMLAQRFDGSIEFLLVDGRSEDGTREILDQLAAGDRRIRVLDNPARSTPSALNTGLRDARGEFVARMDAHSYYPPAYVAAGVERLRRGDVDWVSGPAIPRGSGRWSRLVALALATPLGVGGSRKWGSAREIDVDTGVFAGVWRRATLERLGGWDEGWPANQDSELAARVLGNGGRIVCLPEMAARYVPRDTLSGLARQYFRYGYYRERTSRRHPHSIRRSHVVPPALALTAIAAAAAPRPLRRAARGAIAAYAVTVAATSLRSTGAAPRDAAALAAVFATMHLSWGAGFLCGAARFGPPVAALARLVRGEGASKPGRTRI
jgi:glycosyltransferase involved in cell wall biosynthesis